MRKWNECRCGKLIPEGRIVTCSEKCRAETVAAARAAALLKNTEEFDEYVEITGANLDDIDIDYVIEWRLGGGQIG